MCYVEKQQLHEKKAYNMLPSYIECTANEIRSSKLVCMYSYSSLKASSVCVINCTCV